MGQKFRSVNLDKFPPMTVNKELQMLQKFKGKFVVKLISSEILESSQGREALILLDWPKSRTHPECYKPKAGNELASRRTHTFTLWP